MSVAADKITRQHLIDPEVCIRCNTCEQACSAGAVTHDDNNYVVDADRCKFCMDCISPCPTGAIDNWRLVADAYPLDAQFSWSELPVKEDRLACAETPSRGATKGDVEVRIVHTHGGTGGRPVAPLSAAKPSVNLYNRGNPAIAAVSSICRLTAEDSEADVRHVVLDFGPLSFPVLEGQSVGIVPPGVNADGKPHDVRLYSVASPRHGERPGSNNLALTVKRAPFGLCSNYLCDLRSGDEVQVTGPFGATFLMPNDPATNIIMICTGTGSAPFRGFTEWRRRSMPSAPGRMVLFFGARRPKELPYFGPLQNVPESLLAKHFAYSRAAGQPRIYVQDLMRRQAAMIADLLRSKATHVYVCGVKGMEQGVEEAFADICRGAAMAWGDLRGIMREGGRYHVETY
jgi:benzoyl-CoA 2,3-epoxidase subunit A